MQITGSIETNTENIYQIRQNQGLSNIFDIKARLEEIIDNLICKEEGSIEDEINDKFLDLDFGAEFDIDATKIGINDAIFFVNLLNDNSIINYKTENDTVTLETQNEPIKATSQLIQMLKTS
ncbi:hypothetical protein IJ670_06440, partial [bacterium]|nr:hypothetical protein [bacterium]